MCKAYLHQASMGKLNQKFGKTCHYPSFWKSYSTSCKGIGGHKKKKIVNVKPQHWHFCIIKKKKQQYQGSKNWCCNESFTDN